MLCTLLDILVLSVSRRNKRDFMKEKQSCLKHSVVSSVREYVEGELNVSGVRGREGIQEVNFTLNIKH